MAKSKQAWVILIGALTLAGCEKDSLNALVSDAGDGGDGGQTQQTCLGPDGCDGFIDNGTQTVCDAPIRNNCGTCGADDVAGLGASCTAPGGRNGTQVCGPDGGLTCASTVVSLTVDDTFEDAPLAADAFEAHGIRATFFVNSPRFTRASTYMTQAQVLDLQHRGHEIGGHTLDHPHLTAMDSDQQHVEICRDRAALLAAGLDVKDFAYPFGENSDVTQQAARDCNFNAARAIGGLSDSVGGALAESFVPADVFAIRTPSSLDVTTSLAQMQTYVTNAEMDGGWVIINMHHDCDECSTIAVSPDALTSFLDWLVARSAQGTVVQTLRQMVGGPTKPAVDWSLSAGPDGNWLINGSLESTTFDAGFPDCWEPFGEGVNTSAWSAGVPHTGSAAVQLTVSDYVSGARGLMSKHDFGGCSPVLAPGKSYKVSAWYIAPTDTPVFQLDYFYQGTWLTWQFSPRFPLASSYTQAVWTTPPLPVEVQQVSVGLMLNSNGTLTVDDLALEEAP